MSSTSAIWHRFASHVATQGDKPAIIDVARDIALSYTNLASRAIAMSDALEPFAAENLIFIGEPQIEALPLILAMARLGRAFVPISESEPAARLTQSFINLPGRSLVVSRSGLEGIPVLEEALGSDLQVLGLTWQWSPYTAELPIGPSPFLITHSSGSTGTPKRVAFSQATKLARTDQSIKLFSITHEDRILSACPIHHSLGQRHLCCAVMSGATLIKAYPFSTDLWIEAVTRHKVSFSIPVATHLKILHSRILKDPMLLSSFRSLVTSSAPAEAEFKKQLLDAADFEFWEVYGMTETACVTAVRYVPGADTAHLGKAVPGSQIRIANPDDSGAGEIQVLSDFLADSYWGDSARWQAALTPDGWFKSGDMGRLDEAGNLLYLGRLTESFVSSGLLVFPAEIEAIISEITQVEDCIAFGKPDPIFGNLVVVAYTAKGEISNRDIIHHARARLPKHLWPARIILQDSFPQLPSGKLDRRGLTAKLSV